MEIDPDILVTVCESLRHQYLAILYTCTYTYYMCIYIQWLGFIQTGGGGGEEREDIPPS